MNRSLRRDRAVFPPNPKRRQATALYTEFAKAGKGSSLAAFEPVTEYTARHEKELERFLLTGQRGWVPRSKKDASR
jgi:hypothetical protein